MTINDCEALPHMCSVTFEQRVHAYVAEGEANDGGLVQVSSDRGLQRQEARQISKHVRLHSPPPSGRLAADRSSESRSQEIQMRMNSSSLLHISIRLGEYNMNKQNSSVQQKILNIYILEYSIFIVHFPYFAC